MGDAGIGFHHEGDAGPDAGSDGFSTAPGRLLRFAIQRIELGLPLGYELGATGLGLLGLSQAHLDLPAKAVMATPAIATTGTTIALQRAG
jgi:hypothetical protein